MDRGIQNILIKSGLAALILLISAYLFTSPAYSQITNEKVTVIDTVDDEEDLFDENTDYKELYKDLNKDGEWVTIKESSLYDSTDSDAKNVTNIRIINVWKPNGMSPDWSPYSEGRWTYTYTGWIWVTDYLWGWATYHYGRWVYDYYYGWVWMPGRYWAPSWVQWCYDSYYIGWYPIYPRCHRWYHGYRNRYYAHGHHHHWVVVRRKDFTEKINKDITVDSKENKRILEGSKTTVIVKKDGNNFVNIGPKVEVVENNTGKKIEPKKVTIDDTKGITKVDETSVSLYRNDVQKNAVNTGNKNITSNNGNKTKNTEINERTPEVNNESTKEKAPKNKDENTNRNKQPNYEGSKEKAPEQKVKTESKQPNYEGSKEKAPEKKVKTENKSPSYEGSKERSRQESSHSRDNNSRNRESNNSGRSNEGSRDRGNNNSKTSNRK